MSDLNTGISKADRDRAAAQAIKVAAARPEAHDAWFRIGSLNVQSGNTVSQVIADIQRFLLNSNADVVCLQEALGVYASLPAAFPDFTFVAPVTTTVGDDTGDGDGSTIQDDDVPRTKSVPIMVRTSTCKIVGTDCFVGSKADLNNEDDGTSGTPSAATSDDGVAPTVNTSADDNTVVFPVVLVRFVHRETQQLVKVLNTQMPDPDNDAEMYGVHTARLARMVRQTPASMLVFATGGWEVDYRDRNLKNPDWPMLALGKAKMAANWSYGIGDLPASGVKTIGMSSLPDQIYARRDDAVSFVADMLVSTTYSDHYGLLGTYALTKVDTAVPDPEGDDDQQPQPVTHPSDSVVTLATLALTTGPTQAQAISDLATLDAAVLGADIMATQDRGGSTRDDLFDDERINAYKDDVVDTVGVAFRRGRFKRVSGRAFSLFPSGSVAYTHRKARPAYAGHIQGWEDVLVDQRTNRTITVWSVDVLPFDDYDTQASATFETIAAQARKTDDEALFVVMGKFYTDAKQVGYSTPSGRFRAMGMTTNWFSLGYTAGTTNGSNHSDYIAVLDRSWARWKSQQVVTGLHSGHNGLSANLTLKAKKRSPVTTTPGTPPPSNDPPPDTGPTGLTKTSYVINIATANIKHDLGPSDVATCGSVISSVADVVGCQELKDDSDHNAIRSAMPGFTFKFFHHQEDIGYRTSLMSEAGDSVMPTGLAKQGMLFLYGAYHHVTPSRWITWVSLVPHAHPNTKPIVIMDTHFVAGAWNSKTHQGYESWRRSTWNLHYQKMAEHIRTYQAGGATVIFMGDMNRMRMQAFPGTHWLNQGGIDRIGVAEATHGAQVTLLGSGSRPDPSDHDVKFVKVRIDT